MVFGGSLEIAFGAKSVVELVNNEIAEEVSTCVGAPYSRVVYASLR